MLSCPLNSVKPGDRYWYRYLPYHIKIFFKTIVAKIGIKMSILILIKLRFLVDNPTLTVYRGHCLQTSLNIWYFCTAVFCYLLLNVNTYVIY